MLPSVMGSITWPRFAEIRDAWIIAVARPVVRQPGRPCNFIMVDEAQDMGVVRLRFFATLGEDRPNARFFAGDLGQRIFQQPFSWRALGVDIRGRSSNLHVNHRTSHQIRQSADRPLDPDQTDADGNTENRAGTVCIFWNERWNSREPEKGFEPLAPALQERCSDQLSYSGVALIVDTAWPFRWRNEYEIQFKSAQCEAVTLKSGRNCGILLRCTRPLRSPRTTVSSLSAPAT